jgi:type II secretory pathway component HofQ
LDQFHLGRVQIPASVYQRQLESRVQNERNEREDFLQQAQIEREQTAVEVNKIHLEEDRILRTARAEGNLLRAKANSEAKQLTSNALINGTRLLFEAAGIEGQEQMIAFSYVRALLDRENIDLEVSHLSDENTIKTTTV